VVSFFQVFELKFFIFHLHDTCPYCIIFELISLIIGEENYIGPNILHLPDTFSHSLPNIVLYILFTNTLICVVPLGWEIHVWHPYKKEVKLYIFSPGDGGSVFLWNVGIYLQVRTALLRRGPTSTSSPPWEPQVSYSFAYFNLYIFKQEIGKRMILNYRPNRDSFLKLWQVFSEEHIGLECDFCCNSYQNHLVIWAVTRRPFKIMHRTELYMFSIQQSKWLITE
jgi:hypothetical protein